MLRQALEYIARDCSVFATDKLDAIEKTKARALHLPVKFAYFHGGSAYHRVAVICPVDSNLKFEQTLVAGLLWANKVSNGQRTILYIVGNKFSPESSYIVKLFGPQIQIRLVYFNPKLTSPLLVATKESVSPRYRPPDLVDQRRWEDKFNPVERNWFITALSYFRRFMDKEIHIVFTENWVSIRFKGFEIARLTLKNGHLRITLTARSRREDMSVLGDREEIEGWINTTGSLNHDFVQAFEERLARLYDDHALFIRSCTEKQYLDYLLSVQNNRLGLVGNVCCQFDVGYKGETKLVIDLAGCDVSGSPVVAVVHPNKDLFGIIRCLQALVWGKQQYSFVKNICFFSAVNEDLQGWLICPQNHLHPDIELLRSLIYPQHRIHMQVIKDGWIETGILVTKEWTN